MLLNDAVWPVGDWKFIAISVPPTAIKAIIATIFIIANQNSSSPKSLTDTKFSVSKVMTQINEVTHSGKSGTQKLT